MSSEENKKFVLEKLKQYNSKHATFVSPTKTTQVTRPFIGKKNLVLSNEIYSKKSYNISEKETVSALNELEREGKVSSLFMNGWLWYYLT